LKISSKEHPKRKLSNKTNNSSQLNIMRVRGSSMSQKERKVMNHRKDLIDKKERKGNKVMKAKKKNRLNRLSMVKTRNN
jgi:hypothetical protein